ncbi:hypothetical protein [Flavobacterium sp.]|uniref:hypothetical protein n=1 Tax=Flavobacterium sp. TaxID=239 RepID=UPI00375156D4
MSAVGSISYQASTAPSTYIFYIAKNGVVVNQSKVYSAVQTTTDLASASIAAIIEMTTNDYVEFWVERYAGSPSGNVNVPSLNLVLR